MESKYINITDVEFLKIIKFFYQPYLFFKDKQFILNELNDFFLNHLYINQFSDFYLFDYAKRFKSNGILSYYFFFKSKFLLEFHNYDRYGELFYMEKLLLMSSHPDLILNYKGNINSNIYLPANP